QSGFVLRGRHPVTGDVEDVVDAAEDPEVAVTVDLRAVTGEVDLGVLRPVGLLVPFLIAPQGAQHRRPGLLDDKVAAVARFDRSARIAEPGLVAVTPGSGLMRMLPFSVCHQVSTTGHRLPPMCSRYHIQASGLIGSPTLPSRRRLDRSNFAGMSRPHFMNERMAVG